MTVASSCSLKFTRLFCRLRGTTVGANNKLDVLKILTTGVNRTELRNWKGNIFELVDGWEEDETHDPEVPAVSHSRGLAPFVFVPFEEVCYLVLTIMLLLIYHPEHE
jgi:F-box protein 9